MYPKVLCVFIFFNYKLAVSKEQFFLIFLFFIFEFYKQIQKYKNEAL